MNDNPTLGQALVDLRDGMIPLLGRAQRAASRAPNGPSKHLALLALGSIQLAQAAIWSILEGGGSIGIDDTPTAR